MEVKSELYSGFQNRLKQVISGLGLSQTSFAAKIGISASAVSEFTNGIRPPSKDFLFGLSRLGISLDWFVTGKGEMFHLDLSESENTRFSQASTECLVPVLRQQVSCGAGANWENDSNIVGYIDIFGQISKLKTGRIYAIPSQGISMLGAGIKDGDYILFMAESVLTYKNDMYVFSLDGDVFCKRLEFDKISEKIKIYSMPHPERAELLTTLDMNANETNERLFIFGRVCSWMTLNYNTDDFIKIKN